MKQIKGRVIRIFPTKEQEELIWTHINCYRFMWNRMLTHCQFRYEMSKSGNAPLNERIFLSVFDMVKLITEMKQQYEWLNEVYIHSLQRCCLDLAEAYQRFFKGSGFPKYKRKKKSKPAYGINDGVKFSDGVVKIPKIGKVKYQTNYDINEFSKISNPRIHLNENGKWLLTFGIEYDSQVLDERKGSVGIDLGVKELAVVATDDNARIVANNNKSYRVRQIRRKLKHLQRKVNREYEVGNKNHPDHKWMKTKRIERIESQIRHLYRRLSNIQKSYIHSITASIVNDKPNRVVMEDLNVSGMMKNKHLSKTIVEQCFFEFVRQMKYKCEWNGIKFVQADRFYPSSKTCNCCGAIKKDLKLSDRIFRCRECGFEIDRDVNAALNLRDYVST